LLASIPLATARGNLSDDETEFPIERAIFGLAGTLRMSNWSCAALLIGDHRRVRRCANPIIRGLILRSRQKLEGIGTQSARDQNDLKHIDAAQPALDL